MNRVVITGLGCVTPLGLNVNDTWQSLSSAKSGIRKVDYIDVEDISSKIGGIIYWNTDKGKDAVDSSLVLDPLIYADDRTIHRTDRFIILALAAAQEAIEDSGFPKDHPSDRIGVAIGSGIGGLHKIEAAVYDLYVGGPKRVSPFFVPSTLVNLAAGHVAIKYGYTGPNLASATACSSGAHAIIDAIKTIKLGDADIMIVGGAESSICRLGLSGFSSLKALSTKYNDTPEQASRPFDQDRDGFVIGEGAGIMVIESLENAQKRGAKIYGEFVGYGLSCDAYHITAPEPNGLGAKSAMKKALSMSGLEPSQIGYINAHATSTPLGDNIELAAIESIFGNNDNVCVSSTKSATGHLLGASAAVEIIFTIMSMRNNLLPATLNLHRPPENYNINLIPLKPIAKEFDYGMSNAFGFGGTNSSLIVGKYK